MDDAELKTCLKVIDDHKPLGDWANKPAVPATTVVATNTSDWPMVVEVTGGTVTAVKVDGVTIGARTSGSFRVRAGSTIAWVGSVAPTWQWFYA
jgi:hypothetical protein